MQRRFAKVPLSLHLHDTRGLALANTLAAMNAGATRFDTAIGGIGGSPFTHNSAGNLATEDFLHMCEEIGVETNIDVPSRSSPQSASQMRLPWFTGAFVNPYGPYWTPITPKTGSLFHADHRERAAHPFAARGLQRPALHR